MYVCEELDGKKEGKKWCHKVTAMKYVDFWLLSSPVVKFLGVILEHVVVNHSFLWIDHIALYIIPHCVWEIFEVFLSLEFWEQYISIFCFFIVLTISCQKKK